MRRGSSSCLFLLAWLLAAGACAGGCERPEVVPIDQDGDGLVRGADCDDGSAGIQGPVEWFADGDGDGYGSPDVLKVDCPGREPEGTVDNGEDCDDTRARVYPGADELCDADDVDEDCDGGADNADPEGAADARDWFPDGDSDGFGRPVGAIEGCDQPAGYADNGDDCDDGDGDVHPDQTEVCDGADNDCDGLVDEGVTVTYYPDADDDGFGSAGFGSEGCEGSLPANTVLMGGDCDDGDAAINPDGLEVCDGADNDCDALTDDEDVDDAGNFPVWYRDADGDGFGGESGGVENGCNQPDGFVDNQGDCDEGSAEVNPGADEVCDGDVDEDCDGGADDADPEGASDASIWYRDGDGDGYGDEDEVAKACVGPYGYVDNDRDCDDQSNEVHPGVAEHCNSKDDDCDGSVDEDAVDADTWYFDGDSDGYGSSSGSISSCIRPDGYVQVGGDCDDGAGSVHPGADELCNGRDDDCDGTADESSALDATDWYLDADGDGYGADDADPVTQCDTPPAAGACDTPDCGFVEDHSDCEDLDALVYPGAVERCNNADDDCDRETGEEGFVDLDQDGDTCDDWVYVPPGEFLMGSPEDEPGRGSDETLHAVGITRGFFMSRTEVAQEAWTCVTRGPGGECNWGNPSGFVSDDYPDCLDDDGFNQCPVENVTWTESLIWANALSAKAGLEDAYDRVGPPDAPSSWSWDESAPGYRLPTEAEWEYAIRENPIWEGGDLVYSGSYYDGGDDPSDIAWYVENSDVDHSGPRTHPVAKKDPNTWDGGPAFYDMSGNVWEWVWDWYDDDYSLSGQLCAPGDDSSPLCDPTGPSSGDEELRKVVRGGAYDEGAADCRSSKRGAERHGAKSPLYGFRVVRTAPTFLPVYH